MRAFGFCVVFLSVLTGCIVPLSERGTKAILDDQAVSQVTVGKSTRDDVRSLFGPPRTIDQDTTAAGTAEVWTYTYFREGSYELVPALRDELSRPEIRRTLTVVFDDRGKVAKVKRSESSIKDPDLLVIP